MLLLTAGAPLAGVVTFHGGLIPAPADVAQKTKAKFLILHGALDPLVNKEAVDKFLKSMNDDKLDYQFIAYSGALHAFSNPDADKAHAAGWMASVTMRRLHPVLEPDEDIFQRNLWTVDVCHGVSTEATRSSIGARSEFCRLN